MTKTDFAHPHLAAEQIAEADRISVKQIREKMDFDRLMRARVHISFANESTIQAGALSLANVASWRDTYARSALDQFGRAAKVLGYRKTSQEENRVLRAMADPQMSQFFAALLDYLDGECEGFSGEDFDNYCSDMIGDLPRPTETEDRSDTEEWARENAPSKTK